MRVNPLVRLHGWVVTVRVEVFVIWLRVAVMAAEFVVDTGTV
jgi:hypothetical protein